MVLRVKTFLTSSLITMQNLTVVSHTVCTHVEVPQNSVDAGARPPLDQGWPIGNRFLPMCYRTNFRHWRSNHLGVGRVPKNYGDVTAPPLRVGSVTDHLETHFSTSCVNHATFGHSTSNHMSAINRDPIDKFDPSRPVFQGHSLEQTRIEGLHVTSC